MLFKFLNRKQCPYNVTIRNQWGLIESEQRCKLDIDHEGLHVSKEGVAWANNVELMRKLQEKGLQ